MLSWWWFTWEAQSHTSILRLLLLNPNTNPSTQCGDLKLSLLPQQSLLTVSFLERESLVETLVRVPVPRVLVDADSPIHLKVFDDHIEVKLVLLLPVDHPLVSDFYSIHCLEGNVDELRPLSLDSDIKQLSCMEEVHFYCRNCSNKLTKGLRCFKEMASVNWRDVADNWFGNCCCSFGGVSEKLVAEYAKSYTCTPGVCLLNTTSVLLCNNDILGCKFTNMQNSEPDIINPPSKKITANSENGTPKKLADDDSLSCALHALQTEEKSEKCDSGFCCSETSSKVQMNEVNVELLENQKVFLDGYLGNGFMVRNYTLERMFANQLLESAEDELSFRTIVRDMQTKSPVLQIVLLNPNTWSCAGSLNSDEPAAKLVMHPSMKVSFSASGNGMEFDSRAMDEWVRKNQADEIYMFSSQILELIRVLELAKSLSPPSCTSMQGLFLSSMRR
ncbi:hypothetical protein PHJA_002546600 [Phtheirospermum japonicum]|uniref:Ubiquitin-conjugating enzyme E2C-binding protein n=1 Tax=Phtheirospermum japonicum TaxID=374723 RepID=A0A830CXS1_9LAMI|nr:hypothetical protein PHJA_002546600 [Phtheirospermum japonicum]